MDYVKEVDLDTINPNEREVILDRCILEIVKWCSEGASIYSLILCTDNLFPKKGYEVLCANLELIFSNFSFLGRKIKVDFEIDIIISLV